MTKKATINKEYISNKIKEECNLQDQNAQKITDYLIDTIKSKLIDNEEVLISNFGKWVILEKKSRIGRNPQTGESITLKKRRIVNFHPAPHLKQKINSE